MVKKRVKKVVKKKAAKKSPKKMMVLPHKLSSLIRIALADIRKAEKASDKYIIDMGIWYEPNTSLVCKLGDLTSWTDNRIISEKKVCVMCAAGSVLAFSLGGGGEPVAEIQPSENHDQLNAIDHLRSGDVSGAADTLGLVTYDDAAKKVGKKTYAQWEKFDTTIPNYAMGDPEPFHKAMGKLQAKLAKAGY